MRGEGVKNYIIRVYHHDNEDLNVVVGTVEDHREDREDSFSTMGELVRVLYNKSEVSCELTDDELECILRSKFEEKNRSGENLTLAELLKSPCFEEE